MALSRNGVGPLLTLGLLIVLVGIGPNSAHGAEPVTGIVDNDAVLGPRWSSTTYTPATDGEAAFMLSWTGDGDLRIAIYREADDAWVASDTSTAMPKTLTADLEAGVTYAINVWTVSGWGAYTLELPPDPDPDPGPVFTSGVVDNDQVLGPNWTTATYRPLNSGPVTFTLDWTGAGDLKLAVYRTSDDSWVASNTSTAKPKSLTADLEGGTDYAVNVWAATGSGSYTVRADQPQPDPGGDEIASGVVDNDSVLGPRWTTSTYVPSMDGSATFTMNWNGAGELRIAIYRKSDNAWIASNTSTAKPKTVTADLEADVAYAVNVWAVSGSGTFTVTNGDRPPPPPIDAPNIVVINVDDARPEALEVMPAVQAWFGDEGRTYSHAYVSTPSCCPSRATLMTGQYNHNNGQRDQNTPSTNEDHTIQRYLSEAGYFTAHSGKYLHYVPLADRAPHWDRWTYFKGSYFDVWVNKDGTTSQSDTYSTIMTFDQAIAYAEEFDALDDERPFYMQITPVAPHRPWEPEPQYANAPVPPWHPKPSVGELDRSDKPVWVRWHDETEESMAPIRTEMHRTMMTVDDQVDALMTRLEQLGELDNTLAIFTSDNGYFWGEHGRRSKFLPYDEAVHVPMLVRWPGQIGTEEVDARFVGNVDIFPTVLSAAGVTPTHTIDGKDILDPAFDRTFFGTEYWEDPANNNGIPDWAAIRTETFMYAEYRRGGDLLDSEYYDLVADPYELVNLLGDGSPGNDPDTNTASQMLQEFRTCSGSTCP